MLLTFIVLGGDDNTADGDHLPLESRKLLIGLQTVQVGNSRVRSGDVETKVLTNVNHPFTDNIAKLQRGNIVENLDWTKHTVKIQNGTNLDVCLRKI